jgi:hypothetical protein
MWQVTRRTIERYTRQQVLWNGNIEPPLWTILRDRDHIVHWAWRTHCQTGERVRGIAESCPDLPIVRLRSRSDVEQWVVALLVEQNK